MFSRHEIVFAESQELKCCFSDNPSSQISFQYDACGVHMSFTRRHPGRHVHVLRKCWIRANVCVVRMTKNIKKGFRASTKVLHSEYQN